MYKRFTSSKISKIDLKGSSRRSAIETSNHPRHRITLQATALRVMYWLCGGIGDSKPPGLSRRQARNFWEKVHQRKYFHKKYEFCVHQTCKFHTKIHKFYEMFANVYECQLEICKISASKLNFHQKSQIFNENPEFQIFSWFVDSWAKSHV